MGAHLPHAAAPPRGGSGSAFIFGRCEGIAARGFVNRDSLHPPPDLHSGKLFRRLMMGEEGAREEQGPARRSNRKEEEED